MPIFSTFSKMSFQKGAPLRGYTDLISAVVVFDGSSLTDSGVLNGYGVGPKYPEVIYSTSPWSSNGSIFYNVGVSGQQTQAMIDDAVAQVDPLYKSSTKSIVVGWEIGNDVYFNGNAATAYSKFKTYCLARKSKGFKVIAVNVTPRDLNPGQPTTSFGDTWPQYNAKLANINALMKQEYTTFADGLADVAGDDRLKNPLDTTYYFDGVHHNGAGRVVVAGIVNSVLLSI